jgi:hypothetical protein
MKGKDDRIIPEILEPFSHFFDGFNAHYRRPLLRTPAITAFRRAT